MTNFVGQRILRCSDNHLFVAGTAARLFLSVHLGRKRLMRCPVDGKFRIMENVDPGDLTSAELAGVHAA